MSEKENVTIEITESTDKNLNQPTIVCHPGLPWIRSRRRLP